MKTTTEEMPVIPKIETMTDCIKQIEMSEYECVGGYLKNNKGFIKLKELVKDSTLTLKEIYKKEFRIWVKDNFTKMGNIYIGEDSKTFRASELEAKFKTQLLLDL